MINVKSEPSWNGEPRLRRYRLTRGWGMQPSGRIESGRLMRTSGAMKSIELVLPVDEPFFGKSMVCGQPLCQSVGYYNPTLGEGKHLK
jgi:hypothetical protein